MEEYKYITFDNDDIIEALEDLYIKKNGEKIDIRFIEANLNGIKPIRSITIKKPLSSPVAEITNNNGMLNMSVEGVNYDPYYGQTDEKYAGTSIGSSIGTITTNVGSPVIWHTTANNANSIKSVKQPHP